MRSHIVSTFNRVIQIELNEVSADIVNKLVVKGELPTFEKIQKSWKYLETTSESTYHEIEPWIQWITAHTGKFFNDHKIFNLGDADLLEHRQIWEVLSESGIESAVIGAMNAVRGTNTKGGVFFPDPWAKNGRTYPESLQPLWDVVSRKVQGHASSQPQFHDMRAILGTTFQYKISPILYARILNQIVNQRFNPLVKWKLAALFDEFLAEIFLHVLGEKRFKFCSVFLNAVAHYQHHYWRCFEPNIFDRSIKAPDCRANDNPILVGYKAYDRILAKILNRVDLSKDLVMIVSGLSQIPFTEKEKQGGMNYYRLIDHQKFLNACGLSDMVAYPLMSRDWQVKFANRDEESKIKDVLGKLTVDQAPLFNIRSDRDSYCFVETRITKSVKSGTPIMYGQKQVALFDECFVNIAVKSGHHTGIGSLWVSSAKAVDESVTRIPLTKVYNFGVESLSS
jgi:hypothetical protein